MKIFRVLFSILIIIVLYFINVTSSHAANLLFNSGFEADSHVTGNYTDIAGVDHSVPAPNNWDDSSVLRDFDFNYNGGSSSQRHGDIVNDPSGNDKAMQLWLRDAYGGGVRSTTQIHSFRENEWFSRRKVYIHPDFLLLKNFSGGSRVMFEEIKVQRTSVNPNFRITLAWGNLTKSNFSWDIEAQELRGPSYWTCNSKTAVPIGEWFTLETYYKKGDAKNGRFILTFQKAGGSKQTICNITNWTYSPELGPQNSIYTYNPMKLYMSKGNDVDWIRNNGGVAQLYFDDWQLWSTIPDGTNPTPPPNPTSTPPPGSTPTPTPPNYPGGKFNIGDKIEVTETANVKTTAGEGLLGTQPPGARGTVLAGPEIGVGGQSWWWQINYDNWPDGWSREDLLKKVGTNTPPPSTPTSTPNPVPGDTDGDGDVDIFDYNNLVSDFGQSNSPADFNGSGVVDIFDYNTLVTNFGVALATPTPTPQTNGFIHTQGQNLVVGNSNQPIYLRGVNFTPYFMITPTGRWYTEGETGDPYPSPDEDLPTSLHNKWTDWFKEEHFAKAAQTGFNVIRLTLSWRNFEDDSNPYVYKQAGWDFIDRYISFAKKHNLYLILDMHIPHGGLQPSGVTKELIWTNSSVQNRFRKLWQAIANRYKNETTIAGYDLLNEPHPYSPQANCQPTNEDWKLHVKAWKDLAQATANDIRSVDNNHLLVVEAVNWVDNGCIGDWRLDVLDEFQFLINDNNTMYDLHFYFPFDYMFGSLSSYPSSQKVPLIDQRQVAFNKDYLRQELDIVTEFGRRNNVPINFGEWSSKAITKSGGITYVKDLVNLFDDYNVHWNFWSMLPLYKDDNNGSRTMRPQDEIAERFQIFENYFGK